MDIFLNLTITSSKHRIFSIFISTIVAIKERNCCHWSSYKTSKWWFKNHAVYKDMQQTTHKNHKVEPIQQFQLEMFYSNWISLMNSRQSVCIGLTALQKSCLWSFCETSNTIRNTSPAIVAIFHTRSKSREKTLIVIVGSFNNKKKEWIQSNLEVNYRSSILADYSPPGQASPSCHQQLEFLFRTNIWFY